MTEPQKLTGYFVRVRRDGAMQNVDVADMSDEELETFFARCEDPERLRGWVVALAGWIRENVSSFPVALLLFFLAGCAADTAPLAKVESIECNGAELLHVCSSTPFTVNSRYGVKTTCATTPYLRGSEVVYRSHGQDDCVDVGHPGPTARCCP